MLLVAPDKFAGSMTAPEAARAIALGLADAGLVGVRELPLADGGEGTLEVLDPVSVRRVPEGRVATLSDGRGMVESADAVGRSTAATDSAPLGRLLLAALEDHERVVVALGGSRTWDLGDGLSGVVGDALAGRIEVWCDVMVPLLGPGVDGRSFLAQKGVRDTAQVEGRWRRLVDRAGLDPTLPGGGAAGGLGLMLGHLGQTTPRSGADAVLEQVGFDALLASASHVVTGEGRFDRQSLEGKVCGRVLARCRAAGVPCSVLAGQVDAGLDAVAVSDRALPLEDQLRRGRSMLRAAAANLVTR